MEEILSYYVRVEHAPHLQLHLLESFSVAEAASRKHAYDRAYSRMRRLRHNNPSGNYRIDRGVRFTRDYELDDDDDLYF